MSHPAKMARLAYRGPDIDVDGVLIERFVVESDPADFQTFLYHLELESQGRMSEPGTYARLKVDGKLWMSDTTAERRDHIVPVGMADLHPGGRGLVNGLGMGCVVAAMLDSLDHVDVVERELRIIDTVGDWYNLKYHPRVTFHHDDALTKTWPKGTHWDVVWHDIWPTFASANLPEMTRLHRRYGGRSGWQGSWGQGECRWMNDVENGRSVSTRRI